MRQLFDCWVTCFSSDVSKLSYYVIHRWWQRWLWLLSKQHVGQRMWLRRRSYTFFSPDRWSALWRWVFTSVTSTSKHLFSSRQFNHSSGLWTERVISSRCKSGYLEPQEGEYRRTLWTIWGGARPMSPRPYARLGGKNMPPLLLFVSLNFK